MWKQYFIEFLKTGDFDFTGYFHLYEKEEINPQDINKIYSFPLTSKFDNDCYDSSEEMLEFLSNYRNTYPNCGIKQIPKPIK